MAGYYYYYEPPFWLKVIGVLLVGVFAVMVGSAPGQRERDADEDLRGHLEDAGVVTTATVTRKARVEYHIYLHSSDAVTTKEDVRPMTVRLDDPVSAEAELGTPGFPGFDVGDRVQVVYDPATIHDEAATVLLLEQVELGLGEAELAHERQYPQAMPETANFPWFEVVVVLAGLGLVLMTPSVAEWADRRRDRRGRE